MLLPLCTYSVSFLNGLCLLMPLLHHFECKYPPIYLLFVNISWSKQTIQHSSLKPKMHFHHVIFYVGFLYVDRFRLIKGATRNIVQHQHQLRHAAVDPWKNETTVEIIACFKITFPLNLFASCQERSSGSHWLYLNNDILSSLFSIGLPTLNSFNTKLLQFKQNLTRQILQNV